MPGSSSDLSQIGVDDDGGSGPVEEIMNTVRFLGFGGGGVLIGERARSVEARGRVTTCSRGLEGSRASTW